MYFTNEENDFLNYNKKYKKNDVSIALKEAGLLIEYTEKICELYFEYHTWDTVKQNWHKERISTCGTRDSNQRILGILKRRLQSGEKNLPSIISLNNLLKNCQSEQEKAQILFLYIMEDDPLVKYLIHELYITQGCLPSEWNLDNEELFKIIKDFKYHDNNEIKYADSSLKRWVASFRTLLYECGLLQSRYSNGAEIPLLNDISLKVSAYYSWKLQKEDWVKYPLGWIYLFQPKNYWEILLDRLKDCSDWKVQYFQGKTIFEPADKIFRLKEDES
ncbi:MAG: BrxA family protein [bacterium]